MLTRSSLSLEAITALRAGDPAALIAHHRRTFGGYVMEDGGTGDGGTGDTGDQGTGDQGTGDGDQGDGTGDDGTDDGDDSTDDPRVKRANRQAAQYRTQLRETQQQLQQLTEAQTANAGVLDALRKALTGDTGDGDGDGETDPAVALQALTGEAETLRTEVSTLRAHLLVHDLAGEHNANASALLDSRRFTDTLTGLDPAAEDYRDKVADAIKDAVAKNTNLRAGQGSRRGGSEGAGGAGGDGTVTQEQFDAMDYKAKAQLFQTNPTLYRKLAG